MGLFNRDHRWTFVFEDFKSNEFQASELESKVAFFTMAEDACCDLISSKGKLKYIDITNENNYILKLNRIKNYYHDF